MDSTKNAEFGIGDRVSVLLPQTKRRVKGWVRAVKGARITVIERDDGVYQECHRAQLRGIIVDDAPWHAEPLDASKKPTAPAADNPAAPAAEPQPGADSDEVETKEFKVVQRGRKKKAKAPAAQP